MEVINISNLTCKDVSDKLRKLKKRTPMTKAFDKKYGQKKGRWWDKMDIDKYGISRQQYHIVLYFICKYYNGEKSGGFKCSKNCEKCYAEEGYITQTPSKGENAEKVYNRMQRPEMYLWIIEALELSNENLDQCISELEEIWSSESNRHSTKMKDTKSVFEQYEFTWANIESKLNEL